MSVQCYANISVFIDPENNPFVKKMNYADDVKFA